MDFRVLVISCCVYSSVMSGCHLAPFEPTSTLVYDFLVANKHLRVVTLFVCWKLELLVPYARRLMAKRMSVNMIENFKNLSMDKLFPEQNQLYQQAIILDADCKDSATLLKYADRLFDGTHHWLIITTNNDYNLQNLLGELNLNLETAIIEVKPSQNINDGSYILREVYNTGVGYGGQLKFHTLGKWSRRKKFSWNKYALKSKIERRLNLTGVVLRAMVVVIDKKIYTQKELLDYLASYDDIDLDLLSRFEYKLLECVEDILNIRIEYSQTDSWGYPLPNGSFDGAIGALIKGDAELSGSATHYNRLRYPIIEATIKVWDYKNSFMFRHPDIGGLSVTEAFLRPYTAGAWMASAACAFLLLLMLRLKANYESTAEERSWSKMSIILAGAFCQQGVNWDPQTASGRILVLYTLMFTMLFYQFYSGLLVSTLLSKPPRNIDTIQELINSQLEVSFQNTLTLQRYFRDPTITGPIRRLYDKQVLRKNNESVFVDTYKGLEKVKKGKYVYLCDTTKSYTILRSILSEKEMCDLQEIELATKPWQMFVILRRHSPYKKAITYSLRRINEAGILNRQLIIWKPSYPKCVRRSSNVGEINVELKQAAMPFLILGAGMILSLAVLAVEKLWHARNSYRYKEPYKDYA